MSIRSIVSEKINSSETWNVEPVREIKERVTSLTVFNDELYISMSKGYLAKIDKNEKVKYLIDEEYVAAPGKLKEFNNQLYSFSLGKILIFNKDGVMKELKNETFSDDVDVATLFNDFLYLALSTGRIYKIDKNNNITLLKLPISYTAYIQSMVVFNNQLYISRADGKIFKIDKNENYTEVLILPSKNAINMVVFNNYLYIEILDTLTLYKLNEEETVVNTISLFGAANTFTTLNDNLYFGGPTNTLLWQLNKNDELTAINENYFATNVGIQGFNNKIYLFTYLENYPKFLLKIYK